MDDIREFIVNYVERTGKLSERADLDSFNFVQSGHIDSIGLFKFIIDLDEKFDIEITDNELLLPQILTIGGLAAFISEKRGARHNG